VAGFCTNQVQLSPSELELVLANTERTFMTVLTGLTDSFRNNGRPP